MSSSPLDHSSHFHSIRRRDFVRWGSLSAALAAFTPGRVRAVSPFIPTRDDQLLSIDPEDRAAVFASARTVAAAAIEAARAAGAQYADVRLTHDLINRLTNLWPIDYSQVSAIGVRTLVDGCWGFAASPVWSSAEAARLAQEAVGQAQRNRWQGDRGIHFVDTIPPAQGDWVMPIERDPFEIPENELMDWLKTIELSVAFLPERGSPAVAIGVTARRQQRTFASSEGALCTQTTYAVLEHPSALLINITNPKTREQIRHRSSAITPMGAGWEAIRKMDINAVLQQLYEEAWLIMEAEPVTIGREDIVCDAMTAAALVHESLGVPLQIDRALGYEANAAGTSYLDYTVPSFSLSSPRLNVRGHRNQPGGLATVKWDDEGVEPIGVDFITDGVVTEYATSREHVAMRDAQQRSAGKTQGDVQRNMKNAARSFGCAGSENALGFTMVQSPNLELVPALQGGSFDELVAATEHGYALYNGTVSMDQQQLTGMIIPALAREIRQGKLGKAVRGAGVLFRSPELWKNLAGIGGPGTSLWRGFQLEKGQPSQKIASSVFAPPVSIRNLSVIDMTRKWGAS